MTIKLSQGLVAIVDDEDYKYLNQLKWFVSGGKKKYASRHHYVNGKDKIIRMQHLIMKTPKGKLIDHINGDSLDNRKENLRICTKADNNRNVGIRKDNKSGYKGVNYRESHKKFRAYISLNRKIFHLGYYNTVKEAALAYNEAAKKYHGEFAFLNIV